MFVVLFDYCVSLFVVFCLLCVGCWLLVVGFLLLFGRCRLSVVIRCLC